jgi:CheY-like chemotaxis protein
MAERILLVDDDPLSLRSISLLLREEGYQVQEAHDGIEALDCLKNDSFDLILSDIFMPRCNGFGARDPDRKAESLAASLGVEALIPKPLLFEDLLEKIQRALKREE